MRQAVLALAVGALFVGLTGEADARSRNGNATRYIHGNEKFYENSINDRVGRNASYAEKFFAYTRLSR